MSSSNLFFPSLTFGTFDAAAADLPIVPRPIIWVWQVQQKAGRLFASLMDGGSRLNPDNAHQRFLMRCMVPNVSTALHIADPPPHGPGDHQTASSHVRRGTVMRLDQYHPRRVAGKIEVILVITQFTVLNQSGESHGLFVEPLKLGEALHPYPYQRALEELSDVALRAGQLKDPNLLEAQRQEDRPHHEADYRGNGPPLSPSLGPKHSYSAGETSTECSIPTRANYPTLDSLPPPKSLPVYSDARSSPPHKRLHPDKSEEPRASWLSFSEKKPTRPDPQQNAERAFPEPTSLPSHQDRTGASNVTGMYEGTSSSALGRPAPISTAEPGRYRQSGSIARRLDGQFLEIKNLTSFLGRWAIKGRFINKGEIRTYSNQRGEGKLWSCDLMDNSEKEGGVIRCTFFNRAVDKFYPLITENHIYTVSRGTVKPANRKFNTGTHAFEIQFGEDAEIQWVAADDPSIPTRPVAPVTQIADLGTLPKQTIVSVCGVVLHVADPSEVIMRTTGQPRGKRELTLVDTSEVSIDVTLWGSKTSLLDPVLGLLEASSKDCSPIIVLLENVRVDEYNGRKLSSVGHTSLTLLDAQPSSGQSTADCARHAKRIHQWWCTRQGSAALSPGTLGSGSADGYGFRSLTSASWGSGATDSATNRAGTGEVLRIADLRKQALAAPEHELEDRGCWFSCRATLVNINCERQFYWTACPNCGKKVTPSGSDSQHDPFVGGYLGSEIGSRDTGAWGADDAPHSGTSRSSISGKDLICSFCHKEIASPVRKYLLNLEISDTSGSIRCTALGDRGTQIMGGVSADVLVAVKNNEPGGGYEAFGKNNVGTGSVPYQRYEDYFWQRLRREYIFRIQAKTETYRDETRLRYRVFGIDSINGVIHSDPSTSPNGLATCRTNMIRSARNILDAIYSRISTAPFCATSRSDN